jgi:MFS family permease
MGFLGVPYGGLVGFLPLLAQARGLGPTGWAYTTYTVTAIVGGPLAGWISDRFGRQKVIVPGALVVIVSQLGLALVARRWGLLGLTALYGLGWGALRTGVDALVQDSAGSKARSSAVAAQYTSFDLGVGGGSLGLGTLAEAASYTAAYGLAGGAALLGLGLLTVVGEPARIDDPQEND